MRIEVITGGTSITLDMIIPENWRKSKVKNARVMWLLHGKFDSSSDWISNTQAELFAEQYNLAMVCPSANSARYINWIGGCTWQDYITTDLYDYVHAMLPLSYRPEDNMLFGFGRGGFGALKFRLLFPEKFGAVYTVSYNDAFIQNYINGTGSGKFYESYQSPENTAKSAENMDWLIEMYAKSGKKKPPIHMAWGKSEKVSQRNIALCDKLISNGYPATYEACDTDGGWFFCNNQLEKVLNMSER